MAYDGSRYNGWQKQGNTDKTIQGKLEQILFKMTGEEIEVHGSGRTDAGVHARGQVANFHIDWKKLEVQEKRELEKKAGISILSYDLKLNYLCEECRKEIQEKGM